MSLRSLYTIVICMFSLALTNATLAGAYDFTRIAHSSGQFSSFSGWTAINENGVVAFSGLLDSGVEGVFTGDGAQFTTIADNSIEFSYFNFFSINNNNTVAFRAYLDVGGTGIYTGNGGPVSTIVDSSGQYTHFGQPSINDYGVVAVQADFDYTGGGEVIFTSNGSETTEIANANGELYQLGHPPTILNSGAVAFFARYQGGEGIYTGDGGPITSLYDTSGEYSTFSNPVTFNNNGVVGFRSDLDAGEAGIFTGDGVTTTTIAVTGTNYVHFSHGPAINDNGSVVFIGYTDAISSGLFTGPDSVADKIIRRGDELDGRTVISVSYGPYALNNSGQIAFNAYLSDRTSGIYVAAPIVAVVSVDIDIKPGSNKNPINPGAEGKFTVAILTTEDFDASRVDASTVQFGPSAAAPVRYRLDNVDDDGDWDLVLKFKTQQTGIACGDTEATLTGQMFDGTQITGMDYIKTVRCMQ